MFVKKLIPFAVAASFAMAGAAAFAKTEFVTIGTGGITGVYYPTGGAIAKIVNAKKDQYGVRASVESTGGSKFNINAIDSKDLDFGIAQADTQYMAYNGKGAWEGKPVQKLRAVFALAPEAVTFVAAEDANIKSVKDVKGKPADAPRILQDGRIDGFFYTVGHPNGNIKEATAGKRKVRIVPITEAEVASLLKEAPYYSMTEIPMDQYPDAVNAKDKVKTVGMLATLVTSADTPDDVVYAVTKEVMTNLDQFRKLHPALANLTAESMLQGLTAPIHPGALKYYKEAGLVK